MLFVGVLRYEWLVKCPKKDVNWVNLAPDTNQNALILILNVALITQTCSVYRLLFI